MRSTTFRNEGCALAAFLAPWAMAACGSRAVAASTSAPEGGSESPSPSDASASPELQAPGIDVTLPSATAFADVNVEADFTQPVILPPPATTIAGDSASLVGSWVQLASDGSVCTPATSPYQNGLWVGICFHLDIQKDDAGAVEGTIRLEAASLTSRPVLALLDGGLPASAQPTGFPPSVLGPFPPVTDPNVGYPPAVSPSDYYVLEQSGPNVEYRVLDGIVTNGSFTFWFSPLDLWSNWCALQMPYVWNVGGQVKYRCVPQTATSANTDVGKLALCSSGDDGPQCTDAMGVIRPCPCVDSDARFNPDMLSGCRSTVCECSATQCDARLRGIERSAMFTLEGGKLVGSILGYSYVPPVVPEPPFTFARADQ